MARGTRIRNAGKGADFAPDHRPSPEALAGLIEYIIPEARQISETVAFLLELAHRELSKKLAEGGTGGGEGGSAGGPGEQP